VLSQRIATVQSNSAVGHTDDRFERPLPVCCRHCGKRLKSISRTSNSRNSLKKQVAHTGNTLKRHLGNELLRWQTVDNDRSINCTRLDRITTVFDCPKLTQIDSIPHTGCGVLEWFPVWRTWFVNGLQLSEIGPEVQCVSNMAAAIRK